MKFCWSTLTVQNMEESLRFYEDIVGLRVSRRFAAGPGTEIAFLGDGETQIELICHGTGAGINVGPDISWGFEVDSVEAMMETVREKGIAVLAGPVSPNPHTTFFFIQDPNGMKIQFVEHK